MILVTGCTGYIGSRLTLALLKLGTPVRGLVLPSETNQAASLINAGMKVWDGDLLAPQTLNGIGIGITAIYHLAGLHSASIERMHRLYVEGTQHLFLACSDAPLQACVIASNATVYGDGGEEWLTEQRLPAPIHPFGQITLKMEQWLLGVYRSAHLPVIILRIAEVYGPGEYDLLKNVPAGVRLLGDGMNWTSHIHIDDLLTILMLAPTRLYPGRIYNVSDNLPIRQSDFYKDLSNQLGSPRPEWIPLNSAPERLKLSIHGLRALSIRMCSDEMISSLGITLRYPTYRDWIRELLQQSA